MWSWVKYNLKSNRKIDILFLIAIILVNVYDLMDRWYFLLIAFLFFVGEFIRLRLAGQKVRSIEIIAMILIFVFSAYQIFAFVIDK